MNYRVFPRRIASSTPDDPGVSIGVIPADAESVEISVTFSWDLDDGNRLMDAAISRGISASIGGPACGDPGGDFIPGKFLKHGYVITSRGCPNRCWFCDAWKREGGIRELPITEGWDVLDSNLLACDCEHILGVFRMLSEYKARTVKFSGGLDPKLMRPWIAEEIRKLRPQAVYSAYDTPDDLDPLMNAGKMLLDAGFTRASKRLRCYVLCGFPGDTRPKAEKRILQAWQAGFFPMAMVHKPRDFQNWQEFQRLFSRPEIIASFLKEGEL